MRNPIARRAMTGLTTLLLACGPTAALIAPASAAPVTGDIVATITKGQTVQISSPDGYVNFRSGPGSDFEILGRMKNGTTAQVAEVRDGWSRLSTGGWVANTYLKPVDSGCDKSSCATTSAKVCRVLVGSYPTADKARAEATSIGGGAFIVNNGDGTWSVQVGAFSLRANANTLAKKYPAGVAKVLGNC